MILEIATAFCLVTFGITGVSVALQSRKTGGPYAVHLFAAAFLFGLAAAHVTRAIGLAS